VSIDRSDKGPVDTVARNVLLVAEHRLIQARSLSLGTEDACLVVDEPHPLPVGTPCRIIILTDKGQQDFAASGRVSSTKKAGDGLQIEIAFTAVELKVVATNEFPEINLDEPEES
jgi:hypothetical protein